MSYPFRAQVRPDTFARLVEYLRSVVERFPDKRTGDTTYSMADAALGAFSVFFTQSPSFLDFQRTLQVAKGCNNALTDPVWDHPDPERQSDPQSARSGPTQYGVTRLCGGGRCIACRRSARGISIDQR